MSIIQVCHIVDTFISLTLLTMAPLRRVIHVALCVNTSTYYLSRYASYCLCSILDMIGFCVLRMVLISELSYLRNNASQRDGNGVIRCITRGRRIWVLYNKLYYLPNHMQWMRSFSNTQIYKHMKLTITSIFEVIYYTPVAIECTHLDILYILPTCVTRNPPRTYHCYIYFCFRFVQLWTRGLQCF